MILLNEFIRRVEEAGGKLRGCKIEGNYVYQYNYLNEDGRVNVNYGAALNHSGNLGRQIKVIGVRISLKIHQPFLNRIQLLVPIGVTP